MENNAVIKGRFAPSPSGRIHLGNIFSMLLAWLYTKHKGGKIVLRIEDLDKTRCKEEHVLQLLKDLEFLGLNWDEGGNFSEYRQSECYNYYTKTLDEISDNAHIYKCFCTRQDLFSHSAPHEADGDIIYSGHCKNMQFHTDNSEKKHALRLSVPDKTICFNDVNYGEFSHNLKTQCGDFILLRSDKVFSYQLAVVADDIRMGITDIVRGRDLLSSCARQIYLYNLLGEKPPEYFHIPLICANDGKRLSKREKSMDLGELKKTYTSGQIIGILGAMAGLVPKGQSATPEELLKVFTPQKIGTKDIILSDFIN